MKNHNDVTNNVFRRRDEYEALKRRRKRTAIKAGSSIAYLCLAMAAALGIFNSGVLNKTGAAPNAQATKPSDTPDGNPSKIKINKTDGGVSSSMPDIYVNEEDFITFSAQEAVEYYGTEIFPELPADLKADNDVTGIFRENKGKGKVYFSTFTLNYSSPDSSRSIQIKGDRGQKPFSCVVVISDITPEPTVINGENIFFRDFGDGNIYAEFTYSNVFFEISFHGLSEEEMFNAVSSLTK